MNKENIESVYKLSPMQEGLLFHFLLSPGTGSYVEQSSWLHRGDLEGDNLALYMQAWQALMDRHAVARTSFLWQGLSRPLQVVHRKLTLPLVRVDLAHLDPEAQQKAYRELFHEDRMRGFDLTRPPLMRITLIRLGEARYQVIWTYHHLLMDGWSAAVVDGEIRAHHAALVQGQTPEFAPARPYRDYIQWLEQQDQAEAEAYWRERLAGITAPTDLGIIAPAGQGEGRRETYEKLQHVLDEAFTGRLREAARGAKLTLYTLIGAAWSILCHRYSGARDVLYGTTTSGRSLPLPGIDKMVGVFINTLPNRVTVDPYAEALEWLREQQRAQMRLNQYEYASLQKIRTLCAIPGHLPLFESILVFENYTREAHTPHAQTASLGEFDLDTTTNFPLTFIVYPSNHILFRVLFDNTRIDPDAVRRLFGHLECLLTEMTGDLARPLHRLAMLTQDEREALMGTFNHTEEPYAADVSLLQRIAEVARRTPEHTAVAHVDGSGIRLAVTYAELAARTEHLAGVLRAMGLGTEDLVAVRVSRGPALPMALLATMAAGAAYLPLDTGAPMARTLAMVADAGCRLVITDVGGADAWADTGLTVLELIADGTCASAATVAQKAPVGHLAEATAYAIYTSGSTGTPKGVMVSRGALDNFLQTMQRRFALGDQDSWLALTTVSFDIAALELYLPLLHGARLLTVDRETTADGPLLARLIDTYDVTVMQATPAGWRVLPDGFRVTRPFRALCGGEALPAADAARLRGAGCTLWNLYGPTETTIWSGARRLDAAATQTAVEPVGPPIGNTRLYVLDAFGELLPLGIAGQIAIGGDGIARGYRGLPGLTAARFVPDHLGGQAGKRLYLTGDLGRLAADGTIVFLGRTDHQVKLRGFRIELGEIDAVLARHEAVHSAATVLVDLRPGEQHLAAFVHLKDKATTHDDLRAHLRRSLPEYMVPSVFQTVDSLPLNSSGKVDRRALPAFEHPAAGRTESRAPRNEVEKTLAAIWCEVLQLPSVGVTTSFFDLGGHSLRLIQVRDKILARLDRDVPMMDLLAHPTIEALAAFLTPAPAAETRAPEGEIEETEDEAPAETGTTPVDDPPAIIGMAGRFPGAPDVDTFWANIQAGTRALSHFSVEELVAAGLSEAEVTQPGYVRARGYLDDIESFDADFFGMTPREARLTDPQHRVFLEAAQTALEHAGYDPDGYRGRIGVFGGSGVNTYALFHIMQNLEAVAGVGFHQFMIGNDANFLTTRVSYKLNLTGPSIGVQTACSTSLVAVAEACRALMEGRCEMALAGGVAVMSRQKSGYVYEEGGIGSADGYCRPFDARAKGTVFGSGVGLVVLKRLSRARADRDQVHAVIRGYAVNNDGADKIGYTAPSIKGQTRVIRAAHRMGGIDPRGIGYVEAHGTGTPLGDPIEVAALTRAFRAGTDAVGFCALGSVKSDIGHVDTAAGVAGLIKAALVVRHGVVPPSSYFQSPNPALKLESSPFYIAEKAGAWPPAAPGATTPRRAAVSSFGIGGTNAHVVVEAPPEPEPGEAARGPWWFPLSARDEAAYARLCAQTADYLERRPRLEPADVAFTLTAGRKNHAFRGFVVAEDRAALRAALAAGPAAQPAPARAEVVFLFTGQGSLAPGAGAALYAADAVFRAELDRMAAHMAPHLGADVRGLIYPGFPRLDGPVTDADAARLAETAVAQPALFAFSYALARYWLARGVRPHAMLGHSLGEYVAACVAGVFQPEDAAALVVARARLMQAQPTGAMLGVACSEADILPLLGDALDLAAVNGPRRVVVSGDVAAIHALEQVLTARGTACSRLAVSHAFHGRWMKGAAAGLRALVADIPRAAPCLPIISNVTGRPLSDAQAVDPDYWVSHMLQPVRFADGLNGLMEAGETVFLEVGPNDMLAGLARGVVGRRGMLTASLGKGEQPHLAVLQALGRLWQHGVAIDRQAVAEAGGGRRTALPTYPFQRRRHWIDPAPAKPAAPTTAARATAVPDMCYLPSWRPAFLPPRPVPDGAEVCLVFQKPGRFAEAVTAHLAALGCTVVTVTPGVAFDGSGDGFHVRPDAAADYVALLSRLKTQAQVPRRVVHLWALGESGDAASGHAAALAHGFYSLMHLATAWSSCLPRVPGRLCVAAHGVFAAESRDVLVPIHATLQGPVKVMNKESAELTATLIDLAPDAGADDAARLAAELWLEAPRAVSEAAYRGNRRLVPDWAPCGAPAPEADQLPLTKQGVYLITGGLGGIGLVFATYLAKTYGARLVLTGRTGLPPRAQWDDLLQAADGEDALTRRIGAVRRLEALGAEVTVAAVDVADKPVMTVLITDVLQRYGRIHGVIHAAGVAGGGMMQLKTREAAERVLAPKLAGTDNLVAALAGKGLDFLLLCSSTTAVLGEFGQVDYCAANAYLDAVAQGPDTGCGTVCSVNWWAWREVGMAVDTALPEALRAVRREHLKAALSSEEGVAALELALASGQARVAVCPMPFEALAQAASLEQAQAETSAQAETTPTAAASAPPAAAPASVQPRPALSTEYLSPRNDVEQELVTIWQQHIGLDRVGVNDNFFELGGDSLLGLQVVAHINRALAANLTAAGLYEAPTPAAVARLLRPAPEQAQVAVGPAAGHGARRRALLRKKKKAGSTP